MNMAIEINNPLSIIDHPFQRGPQGSPGACTAAERGIGVRGSPYAFM